eukprot:scaffold365256_cov28-Attheya_sp.AAC.1
MGQFFYPPFVPCLGHQSSQDDEEDNDSPEDYLGGFAVQKGSGCETALAELAPELTTAKDPAPAL